MRLFNISGFENLDRHVGCNMNATKYILTDLAKFHAIPLALKLLKPATFDKKVKKYMSCFNLEEKQGPPSNVIIEILEENPACQPLINKMEKSAKLLTDERTFREPFATLSHKDMWINNFMVKLENGKVIKNKFVDFQAYTYDSPVRDLLFFLFTSVEITILKENLDYFLKFYHDQFIATLIELNCPTLDFSFEKFMDEIHYYGVFEIFHLMFMLVLVVHGKKGEAPSGDGPPHILLSAIPQKVKETVWWIVQEFEKRDWLGD